MTNPSDAMPDNVDGPLAKRQRARGATRPIYWSVRRELWENQALYVAPLAVAGLVLTAFFFGSFHLAREVLGAVMPRQTSGLNLPYAAAAGATYVISLLVAVFYCLGALHGERRDRSLLFWKSLPVSDVVTVLSKAAVPLVVQPAIVLGVGLATQLIILAWSVAILALNGIDPARLWAHLNLPVIWAMFPYGVVINTLWAVPIFSWLILVSAWAKRMPFVWAIGLPLGLCLFEFLAFHSHHLMSLLNERVFGGLAEAFSVGGQGQVPISDLSQIDPLRFFANPGLWTGLLFGAACLAACVWVRRRANPI